MKHSPKTSAKAVASKKIRERINARRAAASAPSPIVPNARVIAMRRALLLGGSCGSVTLIDLSKAENPIDLALVRGWVTEDQHRGARRYARIWLRHARYVLGEMPGVKVSHGPATTSASPIAEEPDGLTSTRVATPADYVLADAIRQFNEGLIDQRELGKAERQHRIARIDWSRLPSKDVVAIFDAAMDLQNYQPPGETHADADRDFLERVWRRLRRSEAQELFSVAVLDTWPAWIFQRVNGHIAEAVTSRAYQLLKRALDVVVEESRTQRAPKDAWAAKLPRCKEPKAKGPKLIERVNYVNEAGELLYEVERHVRRPTALARAA